MTRPILEIADIVRQCTAALRDKYRLSLAQKRVLRDIADCRTAKLGGHVQQCNSCDHRQVTYNSCRNRHCPKCQASARADWMAARERELLPVPYIHLVFTLPQELNALALQNKRIVYGLLFRAAAETLSQVAADPKHLGAKIGFLAVLHTWGQNLMHHPHLHCVATGGGVSPDGSKWVACKKSRRGKVFFLPVRVLSRVFRGKFIDGLKRAYSHGQLEFHGQLQDVGQLCQFNQVLNRASRSDWVVYAKRPFGGPRQVLKYLARYTHRVAISNQRLLRLENDRVSFQYKDYAGQQTKTMVLDGAEFLRRFLLHVLPRGFVRIRHYGLFSNRDRTAKLTRCRVLLNAPSQDDHPDSCTLVAEDSVENDTATTLLCPKCSVGRLITIELVSASDCRRCPRPHFLVSRSPCPEFADSS